MSENAGVLEKIKNSLRGLVVMEPEQFKPQDITKQKVSETIITYLGHVPLINNNRRWTDYNFTASTVLDRMGFEKYRGITGRIDYFERFPREYRTVRSALTGLVNEGGLIARQLSEREPDGEQVVYEVVNEDKLSEISNNKIYGNSKT